MIAWDLLTTGTGHWMRAGMSGVIIGIDVLRLLGSPRAAGCDRDALEEILLAAEHAAVSIAAAKDGGRQ